MNNTLNPITNSSGHIVLTSNAFIKKREDAYQSEANLENQFIESLTRLGYAFCPTITAPEALEENLRIQLQTLNKVEFSDAEWKRFFENWIDSPNEGLIEKSKKLHHSHVLDFIFDNGVIKNIYLVDKEIISRNKLQVIKQFEQMGTHINRYDVTILVNGLPLVQVELKRRGVAIREAFNQIHRYSKESFNSKCSLFKYLQIFVISNGTDTKYFANTTKRDKNSFDFTMNWAREDNSPIKDLEEFTGTFLETRTLLSVLLKYSVFDTQNTLLIMRPYQIAATERILWKIENTNSSNNWSSSKNGGYVWHTTGSGKTLTSFKTAQLATTLEGVDKVLFVVDRKDLDFQTMKEYQRFSPESVNGSNNTVGLKLNLENDDNKIVVTTIQKLNSLMRTEGNLGIYTKNVVFIFDECHRSQFGEVQLNLHKKFKKFCQFGFTGTPIFEENKIGNETTEDVFGARLHTYTITDAIRDEKVLKFKIDYVNTEPAFKNAESQSQNLTVVSSQEIRQALMHPRRITKIVEYILKNFNRKTNRLFPGSKCFNALFAVDSVDSAKLYYETFKKLQMCAENPLKIATIFTFSANEEQNFIGEIQDEPFETSAMTRSAKEFLEGAISEYNQQFKTSFNLDSTGFQNYYKDVAQRVKNKDIDLLIVVGMFLTGFDAPSLNTLFVDKHLQFHGLLQAYSRTNRILDSTKTFGNIVSFRNLESATIDAIKLFGDKDNPSIVIEKSFDEYMGFAKEKDGRAIRGFVDVTKDLEEKFPNPTDIVTEEDKKKFVKLFGEFLKLDHILKSYDQFQMLKDLKDAKNDLHKLAKLKILYQLDDTKIDEQLVVLSKIYFPSDREVQDYLSAYNDIRDWLSIQKESEQLNQSTIDWNDVVFEVDLIKSQDINLDFILNLIFEKHRNSNNVDAAIAEAIRLIRASISNRAKEGLLVQFLKEVDLSQIKDKSGILEAFYIFAQNKKAIEMQQLILNENLKQEEALQYITDSLKNGHASDLGQGLPNILPLPNSAKRTAEYRAVKKRVYQKITQFVAKFNGITINTEGAE